MKLIKKLIILCILLILITLSINFYIKLSTKDQIKTIDTLDKVDAIVILGASIRKDGSLSPMLEDRLIYGISAYNNHLSDKIIMSGDHISDDYNEVTTMKNYAVEKGIPSQVIYLDHYGISTYDSIYRLKNIFHLNKVAIVTQKYHLYRALYIANELGLEAYGIDATKKLYYGQIYRDLREYLARNKDFIKTLIKPKSAYYNDTIDLTVSGDLTN